MINNMDFIFDAEGGIPDYGGARDGTRLILFRWNKGRNQQWRIAPHRAPSVPAPEVPEHARPVRVMCQSGQGLSLTVRDGAAVLATADSEDERQCWVQSFRNAGHVTDGEGHRAFALVNWARRWVTAATTSQCTSRVTIRTPWTWRCCGRRATTWARSTTGSAPWATLASSSTRRAACLRPAARVTARPS
ncbi:unnamed protein product [Urochloa humidicola]